MSENEMTDSQEEVELTAAPDLEGTELESFESEEVEDLEFIDSDQIVSVVESILFSTDKPQGVATIKQAFKGTQVKSRQIKKAIDTLMIEYASSQRGITLEEVTGGYQLRTKVDNMAYLRNMVKARPFRVSGPAMEVMSILAYKQPCIKHEVDEIRGVESGHLLRGLMEKGLVTFAGKSELPGKPMLYQTTRKFLEIFGLRNLDELPSLSEIDDLIPEGIGEEEITKKETLGELADDLATGQLESFSQGEEELGKIEDTLSHINTTSDFFEQEKIRMKEKQEAERARDIREALDVDEEISSKDRKWLERYENIQIEKQALADAAAEKEVVTDVAPTEVVEDVDGALKLEVQAEEVTIGDDEPLFPEDESDSEDEVIL